MEPPPAGARRSSPGPCGPGPRLNKNLLWVEKLVIMTTTLTQKKKIAFRCAHTRCTGSPGRQDSMDDRYQ